jgi:hypothetical protein
MIAKGKSISHLSASIQYALHSEEAAILDKNIVAETPHEVAKEFKLFQELNERCERNSLSFVLSPTIEDGKKLSDEQLENINRSFLEKMHLQDHQYIAFVHKNTEHKHIHLYVNRIDYTGKAYDDQFISNRSAHVAEGIAKEIGLQTAKEVQKVRRKERQVDHPEMEYIKQLAKITLAQREVDSVSKFISFFNEAGSEAGFRTEAYNNKNGAFQGLRFYAGEHKFKASEIDRSLSKQNLEHTLERQLVEDTHREVVLAHSKQTQQAAQEMENIPQEKSIFHKSEMAQTFDLISTLLSANPGQIDPQMKQEPDPHEEERKKKLKKKKAFSLRT